MEELAVNGPIGFRSGTDPEANKEVGCGVPYSHVSRESYTRTFGNILAHSQEKHNNKPNNHCKQIKRSLSELAESHRLFTVVNEEKIESLKAGKCGINENPDPWGEPIIKGKDIDRNQLNSNNATIRFLT